VGPQGDPGPAGADGADGAVGPQGPPGADGADGGIAGQEIVAGAASADNESAKTVTADCPIGKVVVGGGFRTSDVSDPAEIVITGSYPSDADTWTATGSVDGTGGDRSYSLQAYAICANTP
jgi:hypothetical protein